MSEHSEQILAHPGTVEIGAQLPELVLDITPTVVVSTALATRDFQDVHHDRDRAVAGGSKDIFVNILTSTGLVQRYVTDWAGPAARLTSIDLRLGVPCYAGEKLIMTGEVLSQQDDRLSVRVIGTVSLGDHLTATVSLQLPGWAR